MPTLNEADSIESAILSIALLPQGLEREIIVVDGGSQDDTTARAAGLGARVISSPRGRALQMNAGADVAAADYLMFLHADTCLTRPAGDALNRSLCGGTVWGRFDVHLSGRPIALRVVEFAMNLRSRWTGIATGDQAMFVRRDVFRRVGGFPPIPLMEDIALSRRLKRIAPPDGLRARIITSSRKWEREGIARTIVLMWWLRLRYRLGTDPDRLAVAYHRPESNR